MSEKSIYLALALLLIMLGVILLSIESGISRELYPGQYAQVDPDVRRWFNNQHKPGTGVPCCTTADGTQADEDRHDGKIWTRFMYARPVPSIGGDVTDIPVMTQSDWMVVPEEAIIRGGENPTGNPVVWYYMMDGALKIRCYKPAIDG